MRPRRHVPRWDSPSRLLLSSLMAIATCPQGEQRRWRINYLIAENLVSKLFAGTTAAAPASEVLPDVG